MTIIIERLDGVDRVIPVGQYVRPRTHYFAARAAHSRSASIIDICAGESTLVDDLLAQGYEHITVLDVSQTALDVTKKRLGALAERIKWIVADITQARLEPFAYDVWHDRAVFHFLTSIEQRSARSLRCAFPKCGGCDSIRLPHRLADWHHPDTSAKRRTPQAHCTCRGLHKCNGAHTHLHAEDKSESFRAAVPT